MKLKDQHLESTATVTTLGARLKSLEEDHEKLIAKGQDMEHGIRLAEQALKDSEARAQQEKEETAASAVRNVCLLLNGYVVALP